ncbi:hypothetical protein NDU88_003712 [Pleurodeles waltl]|uniref:Uncharacterized protein n=1 Tax=Pleurodeles waltl TaxID=8319 RepID=A0AAV7RHF1_PLEWA|nr:hypothetical protein NDU88_003712 [Pleurodeles waltl]
MGINRLTLSPLGRQGTGLWKAGNGGEREMTGRVEKEQNKLAEEREKGAENRAEEMENRAEKHAEDRGKKSRRASQTKAAEDGCGKSGQETVTGRTGTMYLTLWAASCA